MKRKGISPLIAAVLLIAFTMAVAAILTAWVTTFTEDTADTVGEEGEQQVSCAFAGLSIYDATVIEADEELVVSVANTGTMEFQEDVVVTAFYADGGTATETMFDDEETMASGSVEDFTVGLEADTTADDIDRVRVASAECQDVDDETENIN